MRHLLNFSHSPRRQRARQDYYASTGHTKRSGPSVCSPSKRAGYHTYRRGALGLCHHCIVETPRCAGTSIRDSVYYHIAIFG